MSLTKSICHPAGRFIMPSMHHFYHHIEKCWNMARTSQNPHLTLSMENKSGKLNALLQQGCMGATRSASIASDGRVTQRPMTLGSQSATSMRLTSWPPSIRKNNKPQHSSEL